MLEKEHQVCLHVAFDLAKDWWGVAGDHTKRNHGKQVQEAPLEDTDLIR